MAGNRSCTVPFRRCFGKIAALSAACLFAAACSIEQVDPWFDVPDIGASSAQAIGLWIAGTIVYDNTLHPTTKVQTPSETIAVGRGNCGDLSLLMMYMIHRELGGLPHFINGTFIGADHAWVAWDGVSYESESGGLVDDRYVAEWDFDYYAAMFQAETTHELSPLFARRAS